MGFCFYLFLMKNLNIVAYLTFKYSLRLFKKNRLNKTTSKTTIMPFSPHQPNLHQLLVKTMQIIMPSY